MDDYSSDPTSLLAKNCRMGVRLSASSAGSRMHRFLVPTPTPEGNLKDLMMTISSGQHASLQLVSGSGMLVSHAHARRNTDREEYKLNSQEPSAQRSSSSCWKIFLKIFVALLMGYDRTRETNLTKEKKNGL